MAKITSSAQLNVGTELLIVLGYPMTTVELVATGNLVAKDGVTMQALYSKLQKLWQTDPYGDYPFPLNPRDARSGQWNWGVDASGYYNGSKLLNTASRRLVRDAGWNEYDSAGVLQRVYVGVRSFGALASGTGSQPYYLVQAGGTPTDFNYTGVPNEPVEVYRLSTSYDVRSYLKTFVREQGYTYDAKSLADINETVTGPFSVTLNLVNVADTNIVANDATVAGSAPYTGITVTWLDGNGFGNAAVDTVAVNDVRKHGNGRWSICTTAGTVDAAGVANYTANGGSAVLAAYTGERQVAGTYYAFNVIVAGNNANANKVYTKLQYLLRQNSDIDSGAGTRIGKITDLLASYLGNQLVTATGVYIDAVAAVDQNSVTHTDVGGVGRTIPINTNQTVTISGGVPGTRIQVYDLTSGTELYNGTPTFPYTWQDPNPWVADRQIRLRAAKVSGATAKNFLEAIIGTATQAAYTVSYLLAQTDDAVYNANAIDGSTVTGVTMDDANALIKLNTSRSVQQVYAAASAYLFTSVGIAGLGQAVTATDRANYQAHGRQIKNTTGNAVSLTGGWIVDAVTGLAETLFDTSGGSLFNAPDHIVPFAYNAGGGAPTAAEVADAVWDEALSGHTTAGSAGKTLADDATNTEVMRPKVNEL